MIAEITASVHPLLLVFEINRTAEQLEADMLAEIKASVNPLYSLSLRLIDLLNSL
jgi:hypothetical protein